MIAQVSPDLTWHQIVALAWCDQDFMDRLLSDPRAVLAEHDLDVPPGVEVEVELGAEVRIQESESVRRFILPAAPSHDLLEEELAPEASAYYCYSACGACGRCGGCGCRCSCRCRC